MGKADHRPGARVRSQLTVALGRDKMRCYGIWAALMNEMDSVKLSDSDEITLQLLQSAKARTLSRVQAEQLQRVCFLDDRLLLTALGEALLNWLLRRKEAYTAIRAASQRLRAEVEAVRAREAEASERARIADLDGPEL